MMYLDLEMNLIWTPDLFLILTQEYIVVFN